MYLYHMMGEALITFKVHTVVIVLNLKIYFTAFHFANAHTNKIMDSNTKFRNCLLFYWMHVPFIH
jgi:hypothetical protein